MPKRRIAAIDIGSNAPKMMIAEADANGKPRIVESLRANLALGVDTYNTHFISEESMRQLCEILLGFQVKLEEYNVEDYRVVATSAVREAVNRDFVLARISQLTNFECEVLSNSEERYHHNFVLSENFQDYEELIDQGAILLDLGAGSIQISTYQNGRRLMSQNAKLGYLRISELFSKLQTRSKNFSQVMNEYIGSQLTSLEIEGVSANTKWNLIVVGNDLAYMRIFMGLGSDKDTFLSATDFYAFYKQLLNTQALDLTLHHQVPADVAEILLPAAIIINRFLSQYGMEGIYMPPMQLGEGILLEMAKLKYKYKPHHDHDADLLSSVKMMARRFGVDEKHVSNMERDVVGIHDAMGKKSFINKRSKYLLRLGVWLSEIGKYIHNIDYHVYSSEIVNNTEFIGLSDRETEILGESIRFIPGNEVPVNPKLEYHTYNFRLTVLQLSAVLRIADALEASRNNKLHDVQFKYKKTKLTIHIKTDEDVTLERWAISDRTKLMEELFGLTLVVKVSGVDKE